MVMTRSTKLYRISLMNFWIQKFIHFKVRTGINHNLHNLALLSILNARGMRHLLNTIDYYPRMTLHKIIDYYPRECTKLLGIILWKHFRSETTLFPRNVLGSTNNEYPLWKHYRSEIHWVGQISAICHW